MKECMNVNLGPTNAFRKPDPAHFAVLLDVKAPAKDRWAALMRLDGFDPEQHRFEDQLPSYANAELQRAYKIAFEIHKGL